MHFLLYGIIAVLAGVMSLCLLSACAADEKGTDKESPQETASAEQGFHSERGEGDFINVDHKDEDRRLHLENIKEVVSDEDWVTAEITKFAIVDLDGNGAEELVLWIQANGTLDYGFDILFYKDQEVYGFTLPYRAFYELKTDGTFIHSGGMEDSGIGRLQFTERGYTIEDVSDSESHSGKTDVGWYDLAPESVELAFENKF